MSDVDGIRAALAAQPDLERYSEAVSTHYDELLAVIHDRPALLALLKGSCGVGTLGHRHRLVSHLTTAAASASAADERAVSADARPSSSVEELPLLPATAARGTTSSSARVASMVTACDVLKGPLPFMVTPKMRTGGARLQINEGYPGLHRLRSRPPVFLVEDFLTAAECDELMRCADPMLIRSKTDSGVSEVRTSRSTHLRKATPPCPAVLRKVLALTRKPVNHMEVPQVCRYEPGQFYRMHYDSGDEETLVHGVMGQSSGPRVCTVLIYLNDVFRGGATRFPTLGIDVAPRKGCALVFFPAFTDGGIDPDGLHEALPAVERKYVCQVWVRQRELPEAELEHDGMGHRLLAALAEGR
jgi:prolyl 4-hydroxylase